MPRRTNKFAGFSLLLFLGIAFAVFLNQQAIFDYWRLHNYKAPVEVAAIATQDALTPKARNIFYVNRPLVNNKTSFASNCPDATKEQTIVLGCYHGNQGGIFLLNVNDPRLDGVKQVTAAHEMLHAAYDRLSSKDRANIDSMLQDYYKNQLKDQRLLSTIEAYKKSEPKDVINEMHSIFGTEIATLPAPLERYYQRYFIDRTKVTGFSAQYQQEFTSRQNKIAAADALLGNLKEQIESNKSQLDTKQREITERQQALVALRNSNSIAAYNAGVAPFNALVNNYNDQVERVRALVTQYNIQVANRNAIASEEDALVKSLSADVNTINK